jgi:hypothetical protein
VCRSHCPLAIAIETLRGSGRFFCGLAAKKNLDIGLPSRSLRQLASPTFTDFGATVFAALRERSLVGGDGLEPPTFCV